MTYPSPCVEVCRIEKGGDHCLGCLRTRAEIRAWKSADEAERRVILDRVATRRQEIALS